MSSCFTNYKMKDYFLLVLYFSNLKAKLILLHSSFLKLKIGCIKVLKCSITQLPKDLLMFNPNSLLSLMT
jgi:hypothetical protein